MTAMPSTINWLGSRAPVTAQPKRYTKKPQATAKKVRTTTGEHFSSGVTYLADVHANDLQSDLELIAPMQFNRGRTYDYSRDELLAIVCDATRIPPSANLQSLCDKFKPKFVAVCQCEHSRHGGLLNDAAYSKDAALQRMVEKFGEVQTCKFSLHPGAIEGTQFIVGPNSSDWVPISTTGNIWSIRERSPGVFVLCDGVYEIDPHTILPELAPVPTVVPSTPQHSSPGSFTSGSGFSSPPPPSRPAPMPLQHSNSPVSRGLFPDQPTGAAPVFHLHGGSGMAAPGAHSSLSAVMPNGPPPPTPVPNDQYSLYFDQDDARHYVKCETSKNVRRLRGAQSGGAHDWKLFNMENGASFVASPSFLNVIPAITLAQLFIEDEAEEDKDVDDAPDPKAKASAGIVAVDIAGHSTVAAIAAPMVLDAEATTTRIGEEGRSDKLSEVLNAPVHNDPMPPPAKAPAVMADALAGNAKEPPAKKAKAPAKLFAATIKAKASPP
jgi:hypothetical protein